MKNRNKRLTLMLLLLVVSLTVLPLAAAADVIYEPMDSGFFAAHREECRLIDASYEVRHPNGKATAYVSPEDAGVVTEYENGDILHVSYSYTDKKGVVWACCTKARIGISDGWIPMNYLYEIYSSALFMKDYEKEIEQLKDPVEDWECTNEFFAYTYPGSIYAIRSQLFMDGETPVIPAVSMRYTDEAGHVWGYIGYYYGIRDVWVAMDAPDKDAEELYPDGLLKIDPRADSHASVQNSPAAEKDKTGEKEIKPAPNPRIMWIGLGGAAVAAAIGALILTLTTRKAKK